MSNTLWFTLLFFFFQVLVIIVFQSSRNSLYTLLFAINDIFWNFRK